MTVKRSQLKSGKLYKTKSGRVVAILSIQRAWNYFRYEYQYTYNYFFLESPEINHRDIINETHFKEDLIEWTEI